MSSTGATNRRQSKSHCMFIGEASERTNWRRMEARPAGPVGLLVLIYERAQVADSDKAGVVEE